MKKLIAVLLMAVIGCGTMQAAEFDAEKIKARVQNIYKTVFKSLASGIEGDTDFEKMFMSDAYNKDFRAVRALDDATNPLGEYWELEHWVQGNDYDSPRYRVSKVTQVGDKARVRVIIVNVENVSTPVDLIMVYERGNWFIDDMLTGFEQDAAESGYVSEREQMREMLKEQGSVVSE